MKNKQYTEREIFETAKSILQESKNKMIQETEHKTEQEKYIAQISYLSQQLALNDLLLKLNFDKVIQ